MNKTFSSNTVILIPRSLTIEQRECHLLNFFHQIIITTDSFTISTKIGSTIKIDKNY